MNYDFENPKFHNGQVTFPTKEKPLIDIFRQYVLRLKYILKPNMILSKENRDIALVKNWGHALELIMKNGQVPDRQFLRSKRDIETFFTELNESYCTAFNKTAVEKAVDILKNSGYIVE